MNGVLLNIGHCIQALWSRMCDASAPLISDVMHLVMWAPLLLVIGAFVLLAQPQLSLRRLRRRVLPWAMPGFAPSQSRRRVLAVEVAKVKARLAQQRGVLVAVFGATVLVVVTTQTPALALPVSITMYAGCRYMSQQIQRADATRAMRKVREELAVVADFLALAVSSGLSIDAATHRIPQFFNGLISAHVLGATSAGKSALDGITNLAQHNSDVHALLDALVVCQMTGAPVAQVLHEQSRVAHAHVRSDVLARAGRQEVFMLIPIVFFIFPAVVLVAVFPGWQELRGLGW